MIELAYLNPNIKKEEVDKMIEFRNKKKQGMIDKTFEYIDGESDPKKVESAISSLIMCLTMF